MTQYAITSGKSATYPTKYYAAHYDGGANMVFMLDADFESIPAHCKAIPSFPIIEMKTSAVTVPAEFFGMSVKARANDALTGLTAKTVRSHDLNNGHGQWKYIETGDGVFNWDNIDTWVDAHYAAGRDIVFTLFGTPTWASARPTEVGIYGLNYLGLCAEPDPAKMDRWDRFCTEVATRYLGKIKYYEVWNEANMNNDGAGLTALGISSKFFFFSGTWAKLSEMVRRANQSIKAVDPTAKILAPSIQGWVTTAAGDSETYFTGMMAASDGAAGTMADWVDIVNVHLYTTANNTYTLNGIIDRVNAAKTTAGVSALETWDTESSPLAPNPEDLSDANLIKLMSRAAITMAARGISRHIYYQYDHGYTGFVGRTAVVTARESLRTLLMSGDILNAAAFTDGRVAYWTTGGVVII